MQWFLKSGLVVLLVQAVNAFSNPAPCWQSSTAKAPPDGRLCIVFNKDISPDSPNRFFYGRSALNLNSLDDKENKTHFCAYEADRDVHREDTYFWLQGTENQVRKALDTKALYLNDSKSPDQSKKWKLELDDFISLFKSCNADGQLTSQQQEGTTGQQQEGINSDKIEICIKSTDDNTLDFGKISRSGKCKIFDATLSDKKRSLTLYQLNEKAKRLKTLAHPWIHSGWAVREGEPFASHSPYGFAHVNDYCILQAFIRGHKYCSTDNKGRYQTGDSINYEDQDNGNNNAYQVIYVDAPPESNVEPPSLSADEGAVKENPLSVDEGIVEENLQSADEDAVEENLLSVDEGAAADDENPLSADEDAAEENLQSADEDAVEENLQSADEDAAEENLQSADEDAAEENLQSADEDAAEENLQSADEGAADENPLSVDEDAVEENLLSADEDAVEENLLSADEDAVEENLLSADEGAVEENPREHHDL